MRIQDRLLVLLLCAPGLAQSPGADLPDVALMRLDGARVTLTDVLGTEGVRVVAYTGVGCPISGKYAPRLQELSERFAARGVTFAGVNANPQDDRAEVAEEVRALGLRFPVQYGYMFKNGVANDLSNHYQSVQVSAMLNFRMTFTLK